jgi:O-acetyl-ADP-ribose deacetylase (regulator of RNase III)
MHIMKIEAIQGDITRQRVDAIVNAANSALAPGGGVCGAIHRGAGPALEGECRQVRRTIYPDGLPVGGAVATGAGLLPAHWVIHAVGPNAHRGETDPCLLAQCFVSSLREAADLGARSVAFPAISAGIYGWDVRDVARIAVDAVRGFADRGGNGSVELVRFVLFDADALRAFTEALALPATVLHHV